MLDIEFTLGVLVAVVIMTTVIHRRVTNSRKRVLLVTLSYFLGMAFLTYVFFFLGRQHFLLRFSALILYGEISLLGTMFYCSRLTRGQTPVAILLDAFKRTPEWHRSDFMNLFSEQELVDDRLDQLEKSHMIYKKTANYFITPAGSICYRCIRLYEWLHGAEVGG